MGGGVDKLDATPSFVSSHCELVGRMLQDAELV